MQVLIVITIAVFIVMQVSAAQADDFEPLRRLCASAVHEKTMRALVSVESSFNPFAIGVVDGRLSRQPKNLSEALDVVGRLEDRKMNYSVGLAQINKHNFARHGLSPALAFDPCQNLRAGSEILSSCYGRARMGGLNEQAAIRAALSCYYSGNFSRGFKDGYVQEVVARAEQAGPATSGTIKISNAVAPKPAPGQRRTPQGAIRRDRGDSAFAASGIAQVDTFLDKISMALKGAGVVVCAISLMWAGYKFFFAHADMMYCVRIVGGGLLIGGASEIAGYILGN